MNKTDSEGAICPFCVENERVTVLAETEIAYLAQAAKPQDGAMVAQVGRYFIIPKQHVESILERPVGWTRHETKLLWDAIGAASNDKKLMELMGGTELLEALNTSWNNGFWAGQRVKHIHMWVIFRYDKLEIGFDATIERVIELNRSELALREKVTGLEFQAQEHLAEITSLRRHSGLQLNGH